MPAAIETVDLSRQSSAIPIVKSASKIQDWYSKVSSRFVDLVSDYAGNETFLVEGDSLLLECFSDPRIDFDGTFNALRDPLRLLTCCGTLTSELRS